MRELPLAGELGEGLVAALVARRLTGLLGVLVGAVEALLGLAQALPIVEGSRSETGKISSTSTRACVPDICRNPSPWAKRRTSESLR
jgi:hypothetical protein